MQTDIDCNLERLQYNVMVVQAFERLVAFLEISQKRVSNSSN